MIRRSDDQKIESPHRVLRTLQDFAVIFGSQRQASVSREISKMHEETVRGTLKELAAQFEKKEPRGEFVVVVGGNN